MGRKPRPCGRKGEKMEKPYFYVITDDVKQEVFETKEKAIAYAKYIKKYYSKFYKDIRVIKVQNIEF